MPFPAPPSAIRVKLHVMSPMFRWKFNRRRLIRPDLRSSHTSHAKGLRSESSHLSPLERYDEVLPSWKSVHVVDKGDKRLPDVQHKAL